MAFELPKDFILDFPGEFHIFLGHAVMFKGVKFGLQQIFTGCDVCPRDVIPGEPWFESHLAGDDPNAPNDTRPIGVGSLTGAQQPVPP